MTTYSYNMKSLNLIIKTKQNGKTSKGTKIHSAFQHAQHEQ